MNTSTNSGADHRLICTVDVVLLTLRDAQLQVLLIKREREPFAGALALPGGYVHASVDQDCADAARRVLRDKAGLPSPYLEQLASFSGPARDPRGWSVSVAYVALVAAPQAPQPGQHWLPVDELPQLPFDHGRIVATAVDRVRNKSQYSSLPVHLCAEPFTLPQLHGIYEALLGEPINAVSFRRKMDELGMLEPVPGAKLAQGPHRPAQLYRLRDEFRRTLSLAGRGLNA
ncbi:NUDIX domain-containing protein [Pelomonas sp. UHG3]|jgi:8-oxo-dGTP diphosphatase|uniref:NUDIX domain-containing protein n=1 Tax=Roseateles hydrophilus TaxID=2975054 RepID=A0ACC6CDB7_9BURK|nr:NUDIX domain-containing protein [Pelomonas sp. UHG3]MCY4746339.1 NUDIX domain-containing protein [Pelomonas sp. UHG3]